MHMSTFIQYLTESAKSYDYKIKIAGDIDKDFATRMETALGKFEVAKMSAGKKTPIQSLPLDFPALSNESVTIFDVTTNYPASVIEMKEYIADYMKVSPAMVVVRKPNEPTEEYQETMKVATQSEYKNKLQDIEYKDAPKVNAEDYHSSNANMSLLKELLKDREENKEHPKEKENISTKEDEAAMSPLSKSTNPHPDPKRK
ncbi:MAG: hypothetical protein CBB94_16730 [Gammaproteobacteria bacterium TMED34]|nr:MAG: hypothetical protein CBB94_16730 [Gammaproteobacteria bacterium TMED34]